MFEEIVGVIPNEKGNAELRPNVKAVFMGSRIVLYALRKPVETELQLLEKRNIITRIDASDWGSPLVIIPKANGTVCLCVDYKRTVNPRIVDRYYPIPKLEEISNALQGSKIFCKLDIHKAYLHVEVNEETKIIQTISTHMGTFKVNRLSLGVKTSLNEFQRIMAKILSNLEGVVSYFDDIVFFGNDIEECHKRLACLDRLNAANLHLSRNKCQLFKSQIVYCCYMVSAEGIGKTDKHKRAVTEASRPTSVEDVQTLLGMLAYYSKFISDAATLTYLLRQLLYKNQKFHWSDACESAFQKIEVELSSDRVLVSFNRQHLIIVACDASPTGINGILSYRINGVEKLVAYASLSLMYLPTYLSHFERLSYLTYTRHILVLRG